jgi:hypothetical protein
MCIGAPKPPAPPPPPPPVPDKTDSQVKAEEEAARIAAGRRKGLLSSDRGGTSGLGDSPAGDDPTVKRTTLLG